MKRLAILAAAFAIGVTGCDTSGVEDAARDAGSECLRSGDSASQCADKETQDAEQKLRDKAADKLDGK